MPENKISRLSEDYTSNISDLRARMRVNKSFDLIEKHLSVGGRDMCFFYVDGFVKDGEMQRIMQCLLSMKTVGSARETELRLPYVEVGLCEDMDKLVLAVLSGQSAVLAESFGASALTREPTRLVQPKNRRAIG